MRILVAGASGVLGRSTLPYLDRHEVVGLTRTGDKLQLLLDLGAEGSSATSTTTRRCCVPTKTIAAPVAFTSSRSRRSCVSLSPRIQPRRGRHDDRERPDCVLRLGDTDAHFSVRPTRNQPLLDVGRCEIDGDAALNRAQKIARILRGHFVERRSARCCERVEPGFGARLDDFGPSMTVLMRSSFGCVVLGPAPHAGKARGLVRLALRSFRSLLAPALVRCLDANNTAPGPVNRIGAPPSQHPGPLGFRALDACPRLGRSELGRRRLRERQTSSLRDAVASLVKTLPRVLVRPPVSASRRRSSRSSGRSRWA